MISRGSFQPQHLYDSGIQCFLNRWNSGCMLTIQCVFEFREVPLVSFLIKYKFCPDYCEQYASLVFVFRFALFSMNAVVIFTKRML